MRWVALFFSLVTFVVWGAPRYIAGHSPECAATIADLSPTGQLAVGLFVAGVLVVAAGLLYLDTVFSRWCWRNIDVFPQKKNIKSGRFYKTLSVVLLALLGLAAFPVQAQALDAFSVYWSKVGKKPLIIYWKGADFITGGNADPYVTVEYRRAKESEWKVFDQYALNLPSRKVEVPAEETGLAPGGIYLFRAWQKGVDQKPRESSAGPLTVPGAQIDPADQAALKPSAPTQGNNKPETAKPEPAGGRTISIFDGHSWPKIMFWYNLLASLSGVFILWTIIKCGYKYILHPFNPGVRASLMETVQRCIVAVAIIALAPAFVKALVAVNDAFVSLFAQAGNQLISAPAGLQSGSIEKDGIFDRILVAPFKILLQLLNYIFGMYELDDLIFNGQLAAFGDGFFRGASVSVGNTLGNILVQLAFVGFTLYFNALYILRHWVIVATLAATPLLIWIWVLSEEKQVIEIWAGELVSTIFMQLFHALNYVVLFSIASAVPLSNLTDTSLLARGLKDLCLWVAGFGGAVAVLSIVFMGLKLILARDEKARAEAQEGIEKALLGVMILGLCLVIAGFLAHLLSGDWGVQEEVLPLPDSGGMKLVDVFFMLMVIIPVSKTMHSVFMKLIQRIGTVDEEKWAALGMAGLGSLAGLAALGKTTAGALGRLRGGGIKTPEPKVDRINSGDTTGGATTVENTSGTGGSRAYVKPNNADRPDTGGFQEAIERGQAGGEVWSRYGAGIGGASGFAVPSTIPALAGIGAAVGRVIGTPVATTKALGREVLSRTSFAGKMAEDGRLKPLEAIRLSGGFGKLASEMKTAARELTGAKTTAGAVVRMGTAALLSPMGGRIASWGSRQTGRLFDAGASALGKVQDGAGRVFRWRG